ncbi:MAG: TonB-dependent receptor [Bacteroidota bacterium]|nr:TonB-dependent receptor [Bacteroidota bacterium]
MKIYLILILIALLFHGPLFAQLPVQTVRGRVVDQESKAGIPGANVVLRGTEPMLGAVSDENGNFKILDIPVGRYTLIISSVGYEASTVPELLVGSGKEVVLNINLAESLVQMEEIVIKGKNDKAAPHNDMAMISSRSFTVEETKRYAASINDPARMALSFAGVSGSSDDSNEIIIRGNSPRGLLWKVEGVEIPSPNHFTEEGASGGGVSILSNNMLANSDFFTGAFPAEYGNAFSGVFDIKLRNGNNEQREYAFQAGVMGIDFSAEGPFSSNSKASYLINYRYSTLALLNTLGVQLGGDFAPKFQDLSFKLHFPSKKGGTFSLWSLSGWSVSEAFAEKDSLQWEKKYDRFDESFKSGMTASGITHIYFLNKETFMESSISFSGTKVGFDLDSLDTRYNSYKMYQDEFINKAFRFSTLYNQKISARGTLRTGLIASRISFALLAKGLSEDTKASKEFINIDGHTMLFQGYAQYKNRISEKLILTGGLHAMFLALNGNYSLEPRAGIKWNFLPRQSLSAGIGRHSRVEAMSNYFAQQELENGSIIRPNKNLEFMKSMHYVVGYDRNFWDDLHLKLEAYYQKISDAPIAPAGASDPQHRTFSGLNFDSGFTTDSLVNEGSGKNYGLELTLQKFFKRNYYFMVTNSLYQSKYTPRDGIERNTYFNGNFVTNIVAGKEYKVGPEDKNLLGFNIRMTYAGGKRKTPIDLEASIENGEAVYIYEERYSEKNKAFARVDFRIAYTINKRKTSSTISLDVQNTTNRANIYNQYYSNEDKAILNNYQMGLIPVLNYRLEF